MQPDDTSRLCCHVAGCLSISQITAVKLYVHTWKLGVGMRPVRSSQPTETGGAVLCGPDTGFFGGCALSQHPGELLRAPPFGATQCCSSPPLWFPDVSPMRSW